MADWADRDDGHPGWFWMAGRLTDAGGYPLDIADDEVIPFESPVDDTGMLKLIRRGRALAPATCLELKLKAAAVPKTWTGWDGTEHDLPSPGIGDRLRTRMVPGGFPKNRVRWKQKVALPDSVVLGKGQEKGAEAESTMWMITDS